MITGQKFGQLLEVLPHPCLPSVPFYKVWEAMTCELPYRAFQVVPTPEQKPKE